MSSPLLSVVIPTHKRAAILRQCLEHLGRQTLRDQIEVIVVSDDHDSDTAALFRHSTSHILRATYIEVPKCQQGVARNRGVQEAKGDLVLFIGDDIFLAADACERHVHAHQNHHGDTVVLGYTTWDPQITITPVMKWLEKNGWQFGYPMIARYARQFLPKEIQHRFTYTSHVSLPTSVARSHPFLVTDLYGWEDVEWGKRLAEFGVRLFYEPAAKAWHHHLITMQDSLRRMETLGTSVAAMTKREPDFDRMPRGWKLLAYHLLSILPTMRGQHAKAFLTGIRVNANN